MSGMKQDTQKANVFLFVQQVSTRRPHFPNFCVVGAVDGFSAFDCRDKNCSG